MATKLRVKYSLQGSSKARSVNVMPDVDGEPDSPEVQANVRQILAAEHKVQPHQIKLLGKDAPVGTPAKPKATEIRKLTKPQLIELISTTPALSGIDTDQTAKKLEDAVIERMGLAE